MPGMKSKKHQVFTNFKKRQFFFVYLSMLNWMVETFLLVRKKKLINKIDKPIFCFNKKKILFILFTFVWTVCHILENLFRKFCLRQ